MPRPPRQEPQFGKKKGENEQAASRPKQEEKESNLRSRAKEIIAFLARQNFKGRLTDGMKKLDLYTLKFIDWVVGQNIKPLLLLSLWALFVLWTGWGTLNYGWDIVQPPSPDGTFDPSPITFIDLFFGFAMNTWRIGRIRGWWGCGMTRALRSQPLVHCPVTSLRQPHGEKQSRFLDKGRTDGIVETWVDPGVYSKYSGQQQ